MSDEVEFLEHVYDRFNARDMETVLAAMHEDVIWANAAMSGDATKCAATGPVSGA